MKRFRLLSLALPVLFLATGCATAKLSKEFHGVRVDGGREPVGTVQIANTGWYLLTFIPIGSGNPARPNAFSCRWFEDTVKLESNMRILGAKMKEADVTEVANLTSHRTDEKYLVFILARRAYRTSAVLLKPQEEGKTK